MPVSSSPPGSHLYVHCADDGDQDIYCYACNDGKIDPELALHLATFGINVQAQKKTEKSMTELVCTASFR